MVKERELINIREKVHLISCLLLEIIAASIRVRRQAIDVMISYIFSTLDPIVIHEAPIVKYPRRPPIERMEFAAYAPSHMVSSSPKLNRGVQTPQQ